MGNVLATEVIKVCIHTLGAHVKARGSYMSVTPAQGCRGRDGM